MLGHDLQPQPTSCARRPAPPGFDPRTLHDAFVAGRVPSASVANAAAPLQGLEAEKKLLEASQQRSSTEAQDNFKERCRVSAELEALQKIQAAKCAQSPCGFSCCTVSSLLRV